MLAKLRMMRLEQQTQKLLWPRGLAELMSASFLIRQREKDGSWRADAEPVGCVGVGCRVQGALRASGSAEIGQTESTPSIAALTHSLPRKNTRRDWLRFGNMKGRDFGIVGDPSFRSRQSLR